MAEYSNYNNVFLVKNTAELPDNSEMNKHAIKLEKDKQPLFRSINTLEPIELKTLKTYIKTIFANSLIWLSKSLVKVPIFFN